MTIRYKPRGHGIASREITPDRVRFILTHPAYAGTYVYGIEKARGALAAAELRQANRQEHYIVIPDHHPGVASSREERASGIPSYSKGRFQASTYQHGRCRSLLQGLLRCAICGETVRVCYRRKAFFFTCRRTVENTSKPCLNFGSNDLEKAIVREV